VISDYIALFIGRSKVWFESVCFLFCVVVGGFKNLLLGLFLGCFLCLGFVCVAVGLWVFCFVHGLSCGVCC
jgi:hypothetical protein